MRDGIPRKNIPAALSFAAALFAAAGAGAQTPIKVLLWGGAGGGAHNVPAFRDSIVPVLTGQGMTVSYRQDPPYSWIHADSLAQYDVMLVYTTNQNAGDLSTTQISTLSGWLASGRVMVALHGTTNTFINGNATVAAAWRGLTGGQFSDHAPNNNGGTVTATAAGSSHPALTGTAMLPASGANTGNAPYWDEGRRHTQFAADTIVLARSQIGTVNVPWIWVRPQGGGWVYYTASGHDGQVWTRPEFKGQIIRALQWGYSVKTTGIRGRAALDNLLLRAQAGRILMPAALGGKAYSLELLDMQGRRVFFRGRSFAAGHDVSFLPAGAYGVNIFSGDRAPLRALYVKER